MIFFYRFCTLPAAGLAPCMVTLGCTAHAPSGAPGCAVQCLQLGGPNNFFLHVLHAPGCWAGPLVALRAALLPPCLALLKAVWWYWLGGGRSALACDSRRRRVEKKLLDCDC